MKRSHVKSQDKANRGHVISFPETLPAHSPDRTAIRRDGTLYGELLSYGQNLYMFSLRLWEDA